jgi:hypothetical protein
MRQVEKQKKTKKANCLLSPHTSTFQKTVTPQKQTSPERVTQTSLCLPLFYALLPSNRFRSSTSTLVYDIIADGALNVSF